MAYEINGVEIKQPIGIAAGSVPVLQSNGRTAVWGSSSGLNYPTPLTSVAGTITGTFNGSNTSFTLSTAPTTPSAIILFLNGIFQLQGTDYTLTDSTITMTVAPQAGGQLVAF